MIFIVDPLNVAANRLRGVAQDRFKFGLRQSHIEPLVPLEASFLVSSRVVPRLATTPGRMGRRSCCRCPATTGACLRRAMIECQRTAGQSQATLPVAWSAAAPRRLTALRASEG